MEQKVVAGHLLLKITPAKSQSPRTLPSKCWDIILCKDLIRSQPRRASTYFRQLQNQLPVFESKSNYCSIYLHQSHRRVFLQLPLQAYIKTCYLVYGMNKIQIYLLPLVQQEASPNFSPPLLSLVCNNWCLVMYYN